MVCMHPCAHSDWRTANNAEFLLSNSASHSKKNSLNSLTHTPNSLAHLSAFKSRDKERRCQVLGWCKWQGGATRPGKVEWNFSLNQHHLPTSILTMINLYRSLPTCLLCLQGVTKWQANHHEYSGMYENGIMHGTGAYYIPAGAHKRHKTKTHQQMLSHTYLHVDMHIHTEWCMTLAFFILNRKFHALDQDSWIMRRKHVCFTRNNLYSALRSVIVICKLCRRGLLHEQKYVSGNQTENNAFWHTCFLVYPDGVLA